MNRYSQTGTGGTSDWLAVVKNNPEGLLLLAAGCALLMRGRAPSHSTQYLGENPRQNFPQGDGELRGAVRTMPQKAADAVSPYIEGAQKYATDVASNVSDYASDMTDRISESAGSYASAISDYAGDAGRTVSEQSSRFARQAQSTIQETMQHVLREQPLAVAVVGLAAGAAIAAAFPGTEIERRTLGPTGERLADAASKAGERLKEASSKAGDQLLSAAQDRGLTAEGMKEVAGKVASTFGSTLSGESATKDPRKTVEPQSQGSTGSHGQSTPSSGSQSAGAGQELKARGSGSELRGGSSRPGGSRGPQ
jgi:hypothetical protein